MKKCTLRVLGLSLLAFVMALTACGGGGSSGESSSTPIAPVVVPWTGTKQLGTASSDFGYGVAVDGSGNAYVTGYTSGGLDGNTSAGGADIFLVKYNSDGVKQ